MKDQIAVATYNGFARFDSQSVQFVAEAKDASLFPDHRSANDQAGRHGMTDGFILVDVSREIANASASA